MTKQFHIFPCHFYPFIANLRSKDLLKSLLKSSSRRRFPSTSRGGGRAVQKATQHNNFDPPPPVLILRMQAFGCLPKQAAFSLPNMPGSNTEIQGKCNSSLKAGLFQALVFI